MNIEQANTIPLVEILRSWGFESDYRRGCKKRYRSPLREDRNPSFWIDEEQNRWVDFGTGDGGDVPDLIRHFHHLRNTSEALAWLDKHYVNNPAPARPCIRVEQLPAYSIEEKKPVTFKIQELSDPVLLRYMAGRCITREVATHYCREIRSEKGEHTYFGVAFPTRSGSWEARNIYMKWCMGHKDISFALASKDKSTTSEECCVFEGFMDFLSYVELFRDRHPLTQQRFCDCIILNSIANIRKALPLFDNYSAIHCYLDNDDGGKRTTQTIIDAYPNTAFDESSRYETVNDVNDFLLKVRGVTKQEPPQKSTKH